jgi:hypothetical protein
VQGTKASLVMAARGTAFDDALEQSDRWRQAAVTSPERRAALEAAKKRLRRSV